MPITRNYRGYRSWSQAAAIFTFLLIAALFFKFPQTGQAEDCDNIQDLDDKAECLGDEIKEDQASIDKLLDDIEKNSDNLSTTLSELTSYQAEIDRVRTSLVNININLEERRARLFEKLQLRDQIIRAHYQTGKMTVLELFLSGASSLSGFRYATLSQVLDKSLAEETLNIVGRLNSEISGFERDKAAAEKLQADLETVQQKLVALKADLEKKIAEAEKEVASLEQRVAELSSQQQSILSAKAGEGVISGYEGAEYHLPDSPYSPGFAAMSYGAYTHYNGMSQWGARARADEGQSYEEIIEFYYGEEVDEKDNFPNEVCVQGAGDMDFQKYLYGVADEMPDSWDMDALKAQVIAARSYAYRYVKADKCICTSEQCQVFHTDDANHPSSKWKEAVDSTEDMIIGGSTDAPGYGWYSLSTGGYIENVGKWDDDGTWPADAYEKKAKSPWFYKAWFTQGYADNSNKCGLSTPWLDEEEMADILNAWQVWRKGSSSEKDHISPVTTSCWGGDPYSHSEMREKADQYGDAYRSINDVDVTIGNNGRTLQVRFQTDKGTVTIDGAEFRTAFNLRAPGYIALRSRLYDIEMEN